MTKKKSKIAKAGSKGYKVKKPPMPMKTFNTGRMVFNYMVAKKLQAHFEAQGNPIQLHFGGLIQGYDDWFEEMNIDQDEFDAVRARAVDEKNLDNTVQELIPKFGEQWRKFMTQANKKMIETMQEANPLAVRKLMDGFKSRLKEKA